MYEAFLLIRDILGETNLKLNASKTEFYIPWLEGDVNATHVGLIEFSLLENVPFEKFSNQGMIVGGVPIGKDNFIDSFLKDKISIYKTDLNKISKCLDGTDSGVALGLLRSCLSTRWNHLMRGVAPHFWNQEYEPGISICQFIDNLNLDFLIKHQAMQSYYR
jgi:hypothetical protein